MLVVSGISLSLFLSVLIFFKKNRNTADTILSFWLFTVFIHLILFHLSNNGTIEKHPFLAGIQIPFPLLHGPFLFLYVSELIKNHKTIKIPYWFHFVPFILTFIYLINFFILPGEQKIDILKNDGYGFENFIVFKHILNIISGLGYIIWSLFLIRAYKKALQNQFSTLPYINLKWLEFLSLGLSIIWFIIIFANETLIFTSVSIYIILVGYFGIKKGEINANPKLDILENQVKPKQNPIVASIDFHKQSTNRYATSGLNQEKTELIKSGLEKYSKKEKAYLDPDLSLNILASKIGVHPNYLSQYINEILETSFFDYINSLRIEEFKNKISKEEHEIYNVSSLAYDCGFNSKSSFNRNFKKITGKTPTEFIKSSSK
ncbi:AraC-type DNA-binding protein [Maribacter dokdonensis]|uniref:AraC-type DNA-binding protein n=1 Tax=Maribacter dokdonensis TaxID=320912 RepID=A0ABY0UMX5_9FLAO|nr:AraC family transcriptional regulator [Maribacter dokdonensis]SDS92459.1 AraC-type DNA-binding protein [Maribacter dokdonensis]